MRCCIDSCPHVFPGSRMAADPPEGLIFSGISGHPPGSLSDLLERSYADLLHRDRRFRASELGKWEAFDRKVFKNPDSLGRCVFVTMLGSEIIGFGSYDPSQGPAYGHIGHNCILPRYRRLGYGNLQIREILRRLRSGGFQKAVVTTGEHPFFLPARRMYVACGFIERTRIPGGPDPEYRLVVYSKDLA